MSPRGFALWLCLGCSLAACSDAASADPGTRAKLHVAEGQFVPGSLPSANGGPEIISARVSHDQISPAGDAENLSGTLGEEATALVLGLVGDVGYWVVSAGPASLTEPDLPTFAATLSFTREISAPSLGLQFGAVDARGRIGPLQTETLHVTRDPADAALSIELSWDTNADLDLHVVMPSGDEIFAGNVSSYVAPPPGQPAADPNAFREAGVLSIDSNASCVIDGRREERVRFPENTAPGEYTVRVATASLCAESTAHFRVRAFLQGKKVAEAEGFSTSQGTRFGTGRGAGAFAFSLRVP